MKGDYMAKDSTEYIRVQDGFLEIRQKVGAGVPSKTGKSHIVVGTGGFKPIDGSNLNISLNVIRKN
jgi:hypothetical protein